MANRPKCPKCGNAYTKHTKTKAGNDRYQCKPCGVKPFVPEEIKKKNGNPPCNNSNCSFVGTNRKVHINKRNKITGQIRYICKACGVSFMKSEDYKPRGISEGKRKSIVNSWLNIKDNNVWDTIKFDIQENRELTKKQYLCKHFEISDITLNKIINEYKKEHPELGNPIKGFFEIQNDYARLQDRFDKTPTGKGANMKLSKNAEDKK